jgi:membrane protease YdiL (CAAX protease family)
MLTEKPWRLEAIIRLLAGMVTCVFLGSLLLTILRYNPAAARSGPLVFGSLAGGAALAFAATLWFVLRPWKAEHLKIRAGLLLICAYAGLGLSSAAQHVAGPTPSRLTLLAMAVSALSFQGACLPLIWLLVRQHGLSLRDGFGLGNNPRHALLLGMTAAFVFIPVAFGLQFGIGMLAKMLNLELPAQQAVYILQLADSWINRIAMGLLVVVVVPLAEEGLFRGIFYPAIKGFGYPQLALWGTSVVFALIHMNALNFVPLLVLAVVLVKLYEKTGNLLTCFACHAMFNLFNFLMLIAAMEFNKLPDQP